MSAHTPGPWTLIAGETSPRHPFYVEGGGWTLAIVIYEPSSDRDQEENESGEPFTPGRHSVAVLCEADAKAFVLQHHYSGSYPAARLRVGLLRTGVGLAGVAVFSVPMNEHSIPKRCGVEPRAGVELGRFVLLDEVEGNGESWFLARAFAALEAALSDVRAVLSYSDPMPRAEVGGRTFRPGHVGTIYQAHNGRYVGRTRGEWLWLDSGGRVISPRALSKLRNDESGAAGAYEQLLRAGSPKRHMLESGPSYVERALRTGPFRRVKHPGNHTYIWPVGVGRSTTRLAMPGPLPYPKHCLEQLI